MKHIVGALIFLNEQIADSEYSVTKWRFFLAEAVDMNGRFQMQGGKNWILPK
jgi:hypothetical protein